MVIKQLSVFLENKKGRLAAACRVLADNQINIRALSLADTSDFGILRLIVDKPDVAKEVLNETGVVVNVTDVLAITMDDRPGATLAVLELLAENGISLEYMYACVGNTVGKALMVMQTDNRDKAETLLESNGFSDVNLSDIYTE